MFAVSRRMYLLSTCITYVNMRRLCALGCYLFVGSWRAHIRSAFSLNNYEPSIAKSSPLHDTMVLAWSVASEFVLSDMTKLPLRLSAVLAWLLQPSCALDHFGRSLLWHIPTGNFFDRREISFKVSDRQSNDKERTASPNRLSQMLLYDNPKRC